MKTDTLFHELFRIAPQALFELLQIEPGCPYRFESPVIKAGERRIDGLLAPIERGHPLYFVEVQGYNDRAIYWRSLHEISSFFAQNPELHGQSWQLVILFLDKVFDPGTDQLGTLSQSVMPWLLRGIVPELLQQVVSPSPILNVLYPLIAKNEGEVQQQAKRWMEGIQQLPDIDKARQEQLENLLVQFIMQKFSRLSYKEVETMLQLTPIEETTAGKELIEIGFHRGEVDMLIYMLEQKFQTLEEKLVERLSMLDSDDLKALSAYLFKAQSYEEVKGWIDGRLAVP